MNLCFNSRYNKLNLFFLYHAPYRTQTEIMFLLDVIVSVGALAVLKTSFPELSLSVNISVADPYVFGPLDPDPDPDPSFIKQK